MAAEHARAPSWARTDWQAILRGYSQLLTVQPSHTVAIGRSIAVGQLAGPAAGLADLDGVLALGGLDRFPYAFGARAHLLEQLGRRAEAAEEWQRAADRARTDAEREFFLGRARRLD